MNHGKTGHTTVAVTQDLLSGMPLVLLRKELIHQNLLCMLFKIKSNPMNIWSGALPLLYVLAHVTHDALVAHRHSFANPRSRTSQYRRTFVPLSASLWNDLSDPVFDGVGLVGFKSRANAVVLA